MSNKNFEFFDMYQYKELPTKLNRRINNRREDIKTNLKVLLVVLASDTDDKTIKLLTAIRNCGFKFKLHSNNSFTIVTID
jgi:ribosomal protein L7Ae-like RNA K-turn-binding protein